MRRIAYLLPIVACGVAGWRLFGGYREWVGPVHVVVSLLLAGAALATPMIATRPRAATAIAAGLVVAQLMIIVTTLFGVHWTRVTLFPDARVAGAIAVTLGVAALGLALRRLWGRWLALALGAVSIASSGINAIAYWRVTGHPEPMWPAWSMGNYEQAWAFWVSVIGGLLIVVLLAGNAVHFARRPSVWTSQDRLIRHLRLTLIAGFAAIPMLLVYAWLQPIVPATQTTALVLAGGLAVAGVLAVRGQVIGALLLVACGLGLLAQTAVTMAEAHERGIALYYAVFWAPAGMLALACGARLAGPTLRLLRTPRP